MSKDQMLGAIRRGLRRGTLPAEQQAMLRARLASPPRHLIPARAQLPHNEQVDLFLRIVEREFATFARLADMQAIPEAITDYLAAQNLPPEAVIAPHPELRAVDWSRRPLLHLHEGVATGDDQVGIQFAFAGIAETGTLMLPSGPERPTTINLLPETAIVVLRASHVLGALEDGLADVRATYGHTMPRTLMLITGPSRSSDVEQTQELGAHGPRRLHVLLVDDQA